MKSMWKAVIIDRKLLRGWLSLAPASILHRSWVHEQIVAAAPPPSCRDLQLSTVRAAAAVGGPHSLVTSLTVSKFPDVDTHEVAPAGHSTDHSALGLKRSQLVARLLLWSHLRPLMLAMTEDITTLLPVTPQTENTFSEQWDKQQLIHTPVHAGHVLTLNGNDETGIVNILDFLHLLMTHRTLATSKASPILTLGFPPYGKPNI